MAEKQLTSQLRHIDSLTTEQDSLKKEFQGIDADIKKDEKCLRELQTDLLSLPSDYEINDTINSARSEVTRALQVKDEARSLLGNEFLKR